MHEGANDQADTNHPLANASPDGTAYGDADEDANRRHAKPDPNADKVADEGPYKRPDTVADVRTNVATLAAAYTGNTQAFGNSYEGANWNSNTIANQ